MAGTEQKELNRLRESEEKYRKMIESAGDAIFAIDPQSGIVLEVNPMAAGLTGRSRKELIGSFAWDLHPENERAAAHELFEKTNRQGRGSMHNAHLRRSDGQSVPVDINAAMIEYGDKKVIQRICRDMTEQRKLEQDNRMMKEYYEHILNMMPVGLGVRKNINGSPEVEFENNKLKEMSASHGSDGETVWDWFSQSEDKCCEDVKARLNENGVYAEERILPDNRTFLYTSSYFRDADNNWRELQVIQDNTARRQLEDQLRQAKENLEEKVEERTRELKEKQAQLAQAEKMAALGSLVAGVAHEINTPLGALKSNHDLFVRSMKRLRTQLNDPSMPESIRGDEHLTKMMTSIETLNVVNATAADRIITIVDSLRKFARLDKAEMDKVDLHEGIESTLTLVNHEFKGRITVVKEYGKLPKMECFPNQLNQVYMNVLVNAGQAIAGKGTITIKTSHSGNQVTLEFSDTGKGIAKDDLVKIFDPGFTTKGSGVGTGLGLSIVHQIVHQHSGHIEVDSEPGQGTTMRIILPVK